MRDYRWLTLPGRLAPTDLDAVITHSKTGRVLVMEEKYGKRVPPGQYYTLRDFKKKPDVTVWVVDVTLWDEGSCELSTMDEGGTLGNYETLSIEQLAARVEAWWNEAVSSVSK